MDTFSHGAWGYATLRWRGRRQAWLAVLTGMAPDLLFYIPMKIELMLERGWIGLLQPDTRDPRIWRIDGPPLPPELVEAYFDYYRYSHSLVWLALLTLVFVLTRSRRALWLTVPYVLHILMDIPTHERFLTPILFPLSDWTFHGKSWGRPWIFFPNWIAVTVVLIWVRRRYGKQ